MVASTKLYDLLGVDPDASPADIKKAFRKQSLATHPDKNPDLPAEESNQRFAEVNHAYETLSDPDARDAYDRYGEEDPTAGMGGGPAADMDDFLASMFGGGMGGMGGMPRRPRKTRGDDATIPYSVTLQDLYNGKTAHFNMTKNVVCATCTGTGGKPGTVEKECVKCSGKGRVLSQRSMGNGMIAQSWAECNECKGAGKKIRDKDRCKKCKGEKTTKAKAKLDVQIEKGMLDGQKIVFKEEADQEPGVKPGDIIIQLELKKNDDFQLSGLDLLATVRLTLSEALLGFSRTILTHLDGRHIRVERSTVTKPGEVQVVKGEGMPRHNDRSQFRGDLYIRWEVDFPTDAQLSLDTAYAGSQGKTVRQVLESVLPSKRPDVDKIGDEVVEDTVEPVPAKIEQFGSNTARLGGGGGAYDDDEYGWEDEDEYGPGGGPGVQCAQQ